MQTIFQQDICIHHMCIPVCCAITEIVLPVLILILCIIHPHVILYLPAKCHCNGIIIGGVMTSYRFFKMADI